MSTTPNVEYHIAEVLTQSSYALAAIQASTRAFQYLMERKGVPDDSTEFATNEVFRNLHSFLAHACNVSQLFWPDAPIPRHELNLTTPAEKRAWKDAQLWKERGEELRRLFGVDDTAAFKDKRLRNHLEHFDARIDEWLSDTTMGSHVDLNIGPLELVGAYATDLRDVLRNYDPYKGEFTFRGESYDLVPIHAALEQVYAKASELHK
ncbi:hypothetical protein [Massilia sp. METH4]|uniref:hypothetical protein n=1 Tax=Massilia sp. METH4 TaxID=3123041 RepID=UPI0030D14312